MNAPVALDNDAEFLRVILAKTQQEIEAFVSTVGKSRVYEGISSLSLNVSDDYGDRFLVELIQNAHDAHSADQVDGKIELHLEVSEGPHGCLYVANAGNGFTHKNFLALTNIALSSKAVNAGAGNKGLGFRSVLRICDLPEVYSGSDRPGDFSGYCFGFPDDAELQQLVAETSAAEHFEAVRTNVPRLFLPVPRKPSATLMDRFGGRGLATVVRLPLSSEIAKRAVEKQMDWVQGLDAPLQLFLTRIASIRLSRSGAEPFELRRRIRHEETRSIGGEAKVQIIDTGEVDYLLAYADLNEVAFRAELQASVDSGEVPQSWSNWVGSARVSVAVPLNKEIDQGRMYCFLPMGKEATAPFHGFLDANFYTPIDRRRIHANCRLNKFFVERAAWLCWQTIEHLRHLEESWVPRVTADLLCWSDAEGVDLLMKQCKSTVGAIGAAPVAPVLATDRPFDWAAVSKVVIWHDERHGCLKSDLLSVAANVKILLPGLGRKRTERFEHFLGHAGAAATPSTPRIAGWLEPVAKYLLQQNDSPQIWESFYGDIARLFAYEHTRLIGRAFLRSDDERLFPPDVPHERGAKVKGAKLFFPPVQTGEDGDADGTLIDVTQLPATLKKRFAFVDSRIGWTDTARRQTLARKFLESNRLVREYQTRDVLRSLAEVTRDETIAESTRLTALQWAFKAWSSGRGLAAQDTLAANLYVLTRGGWRGADEALFGDGWPSKEGGQRLERFLARASHLSPSLARSREQLLVPFADLGLEGDNESQWASFLTATGAVDSLRLVNALTDDVDSEGHSLAATVAESAKLTNTMKEQWLSALSESKDLPNPFTKYRTSGGIWILPGMDAFDGFDLITRGEFARQLLRSLLTAVPEVWSFKVSRPGRPSGQRNEREWLSPLSAFLQWAEWMPARRGSEKMICRPRDVWLNPAASAELPLSVLPVVESECSRIIEHTVGLQDRLRATTSLRVLGDPRDAQHLVNKLTEVLPDSTASTYEVRRYKEVFADAWKGWVKQPLLNLSRPFQALPVIKGGQFLAWSTSTKAESTAVQVAYVLDEVDVLKRHLISELEVPTFPFDVDAEQASTVLEKVAPGRFSRSSQLQVEVLVNGVLAAPSGATPLLVDVVGDWLVDFLVCAASKKGGHFFRPTQRALADVRRAAERLRGLQAQELRIRIGDQIRPVPRALGGTVLLKDDVFPTLVFQAEQGPPTWKTLRQLSRGLAEAVGYRMLESAFEVAFTRLHEQVGTGGLLTTSHADIGAALGVDESEVAEVLAASAATSMRTAQLLLPLAAYSGLVELEARLTSYCADDSQAVDTDAAFREISQCLGIGSDALQLAISHAHSVEGLGSDLTLALDRLNLVLRRLGTPYRPIDRQAAHQEVFRGIVSDRRADLLERARVAFLSAYDSGEDLSRYVAIRELTGLTADPTWGETYWELPTAVADAQISSWLLSQSAAILMAPALPAVLPNVGEVREQNRELVRRFADSFSTVISAWATSNGVDVPPLWSEPAQAKQRLVQLAADSGWLDFRLLDDAAAGSWLVRAKAWPDGMPVSNDPTTLGLSPSQVQDTKAAAVITQQEKRRLRSIVTFAGGELSASESGFQDIVQAVRNNMAVAQTLLAATDKFAQLSKLPQGRHGGSGTGGGGQKQTTTDEPALSDEQRRAVGLIGELLAFEWLKAHYLKSHRRVIPDDSWVSKNGRRALGLSAVSDLLGYDFKVELSSTRHYWEVKATTGNQPLIELGPTEIAAAQKYQRDMKDRYRIIFVTNALDPANATLLVLPNPFAKIASEVYQVVGGGSVKFKFDPT